MKNFSLVKRNISIFRHWLNGNDSSISSNHLNRLAVLFPISSNEVGVGARATANDMHRNMQN